MEFWPASGPTIVEMACVIICVAVVVAFLARVTAPSPNPFVNRAIMGDLLSWDTAHSRGLAMLDGATVWLQLDGILVGDQPAAGCHVRAQGATRNHTGQRVPEIVATVLIVERCPVWHSSEVAQTR